MEMANWELGQFESSHFKISICILYQITSGSAVHVF